MPTMFRFRFEYQKEQSYYEMYQCKFSLWLSFLTCHALKFSYIKFTDATMFISESD